MAAWSVKNPTSEAWGVNVSTRGDKKSMFCVQRKVFRVVNKTVVKLSVLTLLANYYSPEALRRRKGKSQLGKEFKVPGRKEVP